MVGTVQTQNDILWDPTIRTHRPPLLLSLSPLNSAEASKTLSSSNRLGERPTLHLQLLLPQVYVSPSGLKKMPLPQQTRLYKNCELRLPFHTHLLSSIFLLHVKYIMYCTFPEYCPHQNKNSNKRFIKVSFAASFPAPRRTLGIRRVPRKNCKGMNSKMQLSAR